MNRNWKSLVFVVAVFPVLSILHSCGQTVWGANTEAIENAFLLVPDAYRGEIYKRYEGSDFVKIVSIDESKEIWFGAVDANAINEGSCLSIVRLSGYVFSCKDQSEYKTNRLCPRRVLGYSKGSFDLGEEFSFIISNFDTLEALFADNLIEPETGTDTYAVKDGNFRCSILRSSNI